MESVFDMQHARGLSKVNECKEGEYGRDHTGESVPNLHTLHIHHKRQVANMSLSMSVLRSGCQYVHVLKLLVFRSMTD